MSTVVTPAYCTPAREADGWPVDVPRPPSDLPYSDGEPLESNWHRDAMNFLIELIRVLFHGRTDYFVGGDMFIYFSSQQARNRDFRGPDVYLVKDVDGTHDRLSWIAWEENGRLPDFIVELTSQSTAAVDRGVKKDIYERVFHTKEYFIYDPGTQLLEGWRLGPRLHYEPLTPDEHGRLWSQELGVWLGTWRGPFNDHLERVWLRFFKEDGTLVPLFAERERLAMHKEKHRAESEKQRAESEKHRADTLQAELERLKALLAEKGAPAVKPAE